MRVERASNELEMIDTTLNCVCDEKFEIPWSELMWSGVTQKGRYQLTGQLLRVVDEYFICSTTSAIYKENENIAPMIGRWHKVIPSTIRRTKFIPKSLKEELTQESEFNHNILNADKTKNAVPGIIDIDFDGYFQK